MLTDRLARGGLHSGGDSQARMPWPVKLAVRVAADPLPLAAAARQDSQGPVEMMIMRQIGSSARVAPLDAVSALKGKRRRSSSCKV